VDLTVSERLFNRTVEAFGFIDFVEFVASLCFRRAEIPAA
jgi:hypothetical protein